MAVSGAEACHDLAEPGTAVNCCEDLLGGGSRLTLRHVEAVVEIAAGRSQPGLAAEKIEAADIAADEDAAR